MDDDVKYTIKLCFIIAIVIGVIITGYCAMVPLWNDMQTIGTEHSYTFVQTKRELLLKLNSDYMKLEVQRNQMIVANQLSMIPAIESQQKAIVDRMKIEAASLPSHEIPREVLPLLNNNK